MIRRAYSLLICILILTLLVPLITCRKVTGTPEGDNVSGKHGRNDGNKIGVQPHPSTHAPSATGKSAPSATGKSNPGLTAAAQNANVGPCRAATGKSYASCLRSNNIESRKCNTYNRSCH